MNNNDRIKVLDPIVAQRIAAGEVIERPSSVVRELLDNSIDAGATSIKISVKQGGIERITVIDDGTGINKNDLALCCQSHATSKVTSLDDLHHLSTMGFRGEALYSIAACSKISIASCKKDAEAWTYTVDNGTEGILTPGGPSSGTRIDVTGLFEQVPARKLFLKRPATEAGLCKQIVSEKALAFPEIEFQFFSDETLRLHLPATKKKQRVLDALAGDKRVIPSEFIELQESAGRFSLYAIISTPALARTDRSHIKVYINNRPIEDYALVQAVTHGYGELLPGGLFPYCYLFITVDPTLVDFNIHPAKREAKLRNKAEIHHAITTMVKHGIKAEIPRATFNQVTYSQPQLYTYHVSESVKRPQISPSTPSFSVKKDVPPLDQSWFTKAKELLQKKPETVFVEQSPQIARYVGQAFNLFIIAEKNDELYLIDQHAAHERILYEDIKNKKRIQHLMIPLSFEVERDVDVFLQEHCDMYEAYGITLNRTEDLLWEASTIPAVAKSVEPDLVKFISTYTGDISEIDKGIFAVIACHAAIKAGDTVDAVTAQALIEAVFTLDAPVCPHGRTFVVTLSKADLWKQVGRT